MRVKFGSSGDIYYIMCIDSGEIYSFDMFGSLVGVEGSVSSCSGWRDVDCISLVGISSGSCEMLCMEGKVVIGASMFACLGRFRNAGGFIGTIFNVPHEDDYGKYNQVVLIYPKESMSKDKIEKIFGTQLNISPMQFERRN